MLTKNEILLILELMQENYGFGYAKGLPGRLQAKLSIMLEANSRSEEEYGLEDV
jgi:hypothetical protein